MSTNQEYRKRERIAIVVIITIVIIGFLIPKYMIPDNTVKAHFSTEQIGILDSLMMTLNAQKEMKKPQKKYEKKPWKSTYSKSVSKSKNSKSDSKKELERVESKKSEEFQKNDNSMPRSTSKENKILNSSIESISDVGSNEAINNYEKYSSTQYEVQLKDDRIIDINSTNADELQYLKGIGEVLSERIIKYRDNLGGFHNINQVAETYGLPPETFATMQHQLTIKSSPKKMNINEVDEKTLAKHLLFSYKQAKWLIAFRDQHGVYKSQEDLLSLRMVDSTLMNKWAPYLSFELSYSDGEKLKIDTLATLAH